MQSLDSSRPRRDVSLLFHMLLLLGRGGGGGGGLRKGRFLRKGFYIGARKLPGKDGLTLRGVVPLAFVRPDSWTVERNRHRQHDILTS